MTDPDADIDADRPPLTGDRCRQLRAEAERGAHELVLDLQRRYPDPAEQAALFHALERATKTAAAEALDGQLDEVLLAAPTTIYYQMHLLTGLHENTVKRRHSALVQRGLDEGWLIAAYDGTGRIRRAERMPT